MGENHGFWVLQAAGLKAGLPIGKAQSDTVTAGGGWVFWVPREAAAQGHTAFGCWAATEGELHGSPLCLVVRLSCQ